MNDQIKSSQYYNTVKLLEGMGPTPEVCKAFFSIPFTFNDLKGDEVAYVFNIIKIYADKNGYELDEYLFVDPKDYNNFYIAVYLKIENYKINLALNNASYTENESKRL